MVILELLQETKIKFVDYLDKVLSYFGFFSQGVVNNTVYSVINNKLMRTWVDPFPQD